jgi:serine/threonine-protein kinase
MKPALAKICQSCGERYDADVLFCPKDGTPLGSARSPSFSGEGDLYLGLELAGQIRLKHLIGIGSMGRVYRAFQAGIDRDVAVKILHRELSGNAELVSRFHREAKVASRLVHPNVVQVLMTGAIPGRADPRMGGELYLVMEYLDGISLLSALAAAGTAGECAALPLPRALHIALQICDAVGEAHAQNIVHRDLKPENIMLIRRGDDPDYVKVLDFGIARLNWGDRSLATQAGLIFGTAKYISPEGAEGHPVTPPADVYSIATMLYQCLAGRTPFEGDSPVALLVQHTHTPPPELRSITRASYVPIPIAAVIMQNLAKKPGERAADARALGRDLVAAARASGLDPEEIISQSTLLFTRGQGAVKLASRERTRALELSPELAAKIGGIPASRESKPDTMPAVSGAQIAPHSDLFPVSALQTPMPARSASSPAIHSPPAAIATNAHDSHPFDPAAPLAPFDSPLDALDDPDSDPRIPRQSPTTMQGTETTLSAYMPPPGKTRARVARITAILACVAAALMVVVVGGKHFASTRDAASSDTLEAHLDAARDCMRRHAWDAPPSQNVKDILTRSVARWPSDPRVIDLRREAAERLVSDALGRKYAGDSVEALHLARLALEFQPALTTAQHLVSDLERELPPDVAPASTGGVPEGESHTNKAPIVHGSRTAREAKPAPSGAAGRPAASSDKGTSILPLPPPPLPTGHSPPAHSAGEPWL